MYAAVRQLSRVLGGDNKLGLTVTVGAGVVHPA